MKKQEITGNFSSFAEVAKAFGCKPVKHRTSNKEKLNKQREFFLSRNTCEVCGSPLALIRGTNVMVCANPDCIGFEHTHTDKQGNEIKTYSPSYKALDDKGATIANNIFD